MSDSLVPVGVSLATILGLAKLKTWRPSLEPWLEIAVILLASVGLAEANRAHRQPPVPAAVLQPRPTADSWPKTWFAEKHHLSPGETNAEQWFADWQAVCEWTAENTPADALFITPREQQTFKWYAGRPEVANWKDVPQDARGLIKWKERLNELYPRDEAHRQHDLAAFSDDELTALAKKYGARFLVLDRTRAGRRLSWQKLYPPVVEENPSFEVYRVLEQAAP